MEAEILSVVKAETDTFLNNKAAKDNREQARRTTVMSLNGGTHLRD